jgi:hypothetical protein
MITCLIEWQSLGAFEKQFPPFLPSVCPHETALLLLEGFSWMFGTPQDVVNTCLFWLISDKNNWKLYMKTYVYLVIGLIKGDRPFSLWGASWGPSICLYKDKNLCCWGTEIFFRDKTKLTRRNCYTLSEFTKLFLTSLSNRNNYTSGTVIRCVSDENNVIIRLL